MFSSALRMASLAELGLEETSVMVPTISAVDPFPDTFSVQVSSATVDNGLYRLPAASFIQPAMLSVIHCKMIDNDIRNLSNEPNTQ